MTYQLTVWELTGKDDEIESVTELTCDTSYQLIRAFDWITRGIKGHYSAWAIDTATGEVCRESKVAYR